MQKRPTFPARAAFAWALAALIGFGNLHSAHAQGKRQTVKVGKQIALSLPDYFSEMGEELRMQRFSPVFQPVAAYSADREGLTFLAVSAKETDWRAEDMALLLEFQKANIAGSVTKADFSVEEVRQIGGRTFGVLAFATEVSDRRDAPAASTDEDPSRAGGEAPPPLEVGPPLPTVHAYSMAAYTVYQGNLLVFRFQCPGRERERWEAEAERIVSSIEIKD